MHRSWHQIESFAASFCALNFIGGVRCIRYDFSLYIAPKASPDQLSSWASSLVDQLPYGTAFPPSCRVAYKHCDLFRSSYVITIIFMLITAAVLAEICSALPLSGSIYIWAAESAGPKYARFFGFVVAWWSCTAWMTFAAGNCQVRHLPFFSPSADFIPSVV